jgi:dTDP-4-amino-4,6-dideoxygalactose transaminase
MLGDDEIRLVTEALQSGTLTSTKGTFVKRFEEAFAQRLGIPHAVCSSHGTSALHIAYAAINPDPGDEIVTTPITDMGALTPMLFQGAVPVFCDVDPHTLNPTAETIERVLSERTRAIVVTHLFGQPCPMGPVMELARSRGIPVIEDCAQAFDASWQGRPVGTIGDIGCFSLQQGKHITTGEGGISVTGNADYARRMFLFVNKAWGYGDAKPDHYFSALNYRMTELAGAVALAQLDKLAGSSRARIAMADRLNGLLDGIDGITTPVPDKGIVHTYWKYCLNVDGTRIQGGAVGLAKLLRERYAIFSAPRYIQKPAFQCEVFREQRTLGNSRFPFTLARPAAVDYRPERFPGVFRGLEEVLVLPWNERYSPAHVDFIAQGVRTAVAELGRDAGPARA